MIGVSPVIDGKPLRGMADECLSVIGVETTAEAIGRHYGARSATGILDGWLIHSTDSAEVPGVEVRSVPLLMTDPADDRRNGRVPHSIWRSEACGTTSVADHASRHCRSRRRDELRDPPDHRAARVPARATTSPSRSPHARPWLADGDILVVTSKIVSKVEGRIVAAPTDPEERDTARRHWSIRKRCGCWRARVAR